MSITKTSTHGSAPWLAEEVKKNIDIYRGQDWRLYADINTRSAVPLNSLDVRNFLASFYTNYRSPDPHPLSESPSQGLITQTVMLLQEEDYPVVTIKTRTAVIPDSWSDEPQDAILLDTNVSEDGGEPAIISIDSDGTPGGLMR